MASEFSLEAVKECMLDRGGRIRNHELVTHFKEFLNDPEKKGINREKFKDFVNDLATIKVEDGEKVLVLKRKYRTDSMVSSSSVSSSRSSDLVSGASEVTSEDPSPTSFQFKEPAVPRDRESDKVERVAAPGDIMRARSEPPDCTDTVSGGCDRVDGGMMSKVHSDDSLEHGSKGGSAVLHGDIGHQAAKRGHQPLLDSTPSLASQGSSSALSGEDEGNVSVLSIKERVQHLNKISSESDIQLARTPPRKAKSGKERDEDEDSHTSGGNSFITLTPEEKEWMLVSATTDYHEMFKLLSRNVRLARVKDIANGYTALHWAAKFGKSDVVKMLSNKIGVNVNQRSHGGYTPLHLAAIQGHEDIIDLLVTVYKADPNIRDYSGKKAKQYLKNSASSRTQQLLVSRKMAAAYGGSVISMDESFTRSVPGRQSARISSMIQATSSVIRQPVQAVLRSSWEGDEIGDRTPSSTPPGSLSSSPASGRKLYKDEKHLMPPPQQPANRRHRVGDRSRSSSRERLTSQPLSQSSSAIDRKPEGKQSVPRSESDITLTRK